jgi:hypothetical protein
MISSDLLQGAPTGGAMPMPLESDQEDLPENLDTDGVMMTRASNMSSESIQRLKRLSMD